MSEIQTQARLAMQQLLAQAQLKPGQIVVVGCSTSEVVGKRIGTAGTLEVAKELLSGLMEPIREKGLYLAVQCCEHLNRTLIVPRDCMEAYGLEEVCVMPQPHAGGSLATVYYESLSDPCPVMSICAHAGMDIGGTLIGMHLKAVAVPVRIEQNHIGQAPLILAKTRPRLVGGERAVYPQKIR